MKKLELKGRKLLRYLFGCVSFTAVAFVFQACYGVVDDYEVRLTGTVWSKNTNLPIKGIKVAVNDEQFICGMTDENGKFDFYANVPKGGYYDYNENDSVSVYRSADSVKVHFMDIDSTQNGYFNDTTIFVNPANKNEVKINIMLTEK